LKGAYELKEHPWLKNYPWKELYNKSLTAPFIPRAGDNFDRKYCEAQDAIGNNTMERYHRYVRDESFVYIFQNFTYLNFDPREGETKSTHQSTKTMNAEKPAPNTTRVPSSSNIKLAPNMSHKNTNLKVLPNKVKVVDSKLSILSTMKKSVPSKKVMTNNSLNFSNSYLTGLSKVTNSNIANCNTNLTSGKYTPTREKRQSNPIIRSKSKGSTLDLTPNYMKSKNISLVSSSSTNNLKSNTGNKLPNIGYLDKLKLMKGINGTSTSAILKHYRHNSISQSSTGSSASTAFKFLNKL
jgi:hypothetical protein